MSSFDKVNGFLLVDKPEGISSFKVVQILRRVTGVKKIGHSGTLDPLATGLMICAIGRHYTRQLETLMKRNKTYTGTAILGQSTDSYDADGTITKETEVPKTLSLDDLLESKTQFEGQIEQVPPAFSAKKVNGKRAYELARQGETITLEKKAVTVYDYQCRNLRHGTLCEFDYEISCSKGTYVRSLIHDLGENLGYGAHVKTLRRTKIEEISVEDALPLDNISLEDIQHNLYADL